MKNLNLTTVLLLLFLPINLTAQYSDFDLSRYKLPDIKINRLDATFNLDNNFGNNHSEITSVNNSKSSVNNFQGSINLDYYHFRNSEQYQGSLNINTLCDKSNNKEKTNDSKSEYKNNHVVFQISNVNRFYMQKKNFFEVDPWLYVTQLQSNQNATQNPTSTRDYSSNQCSFDFSLPVSIGHGRIEPVEDLRLAIYIIEELNKAGKINSIPSDNDILDMAKEISKLKRKRFFDSRIHKMTELQVIDSFLVANKIISSNDIKYFAILNDQWDYASGPVRSAGFAVNAGIDDRILFNRTKNLTSGDETEAIKSEISSNYYKLGGFVQLVYCKPINLYWQTTISLKTSYGIEIIKDPLNKSSQQDNYRDNIFCSNVNYSIQFLPNSRTSVELNLSGNYSNSNGKSSVTDSDLPELQIKRDQLNLHAGFNTYYYVSPRVRLNLDTDLIYFHDNDSKGDYGTLNHSFNHDFTLTLTYSFF